MLHFHRAIKIVAAGCARFSIFQLAVVFFIISIETVKDITPGERWRAVSFGLIALLLTIIASGGGRRERG